MRLNKINQRTLITEGWNDPRLTLLETKIIIPFVSSIEKYITEAQLTPDQINQLFTNVEQGASAAGGNRTLVGKGKDAASFINKKIDDLGAVLKKAGPVQNADAKFAELKNKIGATDSKVVKGIQAVSDWAKANPGKASIAVAILTTAAAMTTGPLGGAVAGFLARATKDLLQGADLSTAVGKSVKTAAYGAIAGWALDGIGDWLEGLRLDAVPYEKIPGLTQINVSLEKSLTAPGYSNVKTLGSILVPPERVEQFTDLVQAARGGDVNAFNELWNFSKSFDVKTYTTMTNLTNDMMREIAQQNDAFLQNLKTANDAIAAIAQGSVQAAGKQAEFKVGGKEVTPDNSEGKTESINLKLSQIETIIEWCDETPAVILTEGPLDTIGGALKKGAAAVGAKAAQVGKNITTKVTADKLARAWKKAGSPTDSDAIANILRQQGVSDTVLAPIYKTMGAKLPAAPVAADPKQPTKGQQSTQPTAQQSTQPAAVATDFKSLQKTVANLNAQDAKTLVTYIDSLSTNTASATQDQDATTTAPKNAAAGDTFEKAKGDIRKVQSGNKPMPPKAAADIQGAIAKLAKGDKESGVFAAQKIMNLAKAGVDVSKQQQAWVANAKAGERFLTQSVYFEITKMLRENRLSWSDLGIRVHLLENTNQLIGISFK